ncbi:hypothetical protein CEXT_707371 [Caerostris extrusa]|uniref:Uncharacterized protein n=1 Tax=Caerostris extrusa TaxID=172846 RepID=A0AAV4XRT4_CAEEX|nr:hypothetical protein CEXT_707371 [Caerostris extrusa]
MENKLLPSVPSLLSSKELELGTTLLQESRSRFNKGGEIHVENRYRLPKKKKSSGSGTSHFFEIKLNAILNMKYS